MIDYDLYSVTSSALLCAGLICVGIWAYNKSQKAANELQKQAYQKLIDDRNRVLQERKERLKAENKTFREYKLAEFQERVIEVTGWNEEMDKEDRWDLPNTIAIQNFIHFIDLFEAEFPEQDFELDLECEGDIECYIEQERRTFMGDPIVVTAFFGNEGGIGCWTRLASTYFANGLTMDQLIPKIKEFLNK